MPSKYTIKHFHLSQPWPQVSSRALMVQCCHKLLDALYKHVYSYAYDSTTKTKTGFGSYLKFHSHRKPHLRLERQAPDQVYFNSLISQEAA